ncbi:riboflavin kinase isoform X1 [Phycodurus eques]|uniref:riboflavin kinase isoform X1 n=2 Tax=Phycodurus eques TaxID=693459 RepID=UPI002ACED0F9|nr:riboflavin kinase isoform X1 [Phycodurus eques]
MLTTLASIAVSLSVGFGRVGPSFGLVPGLWRSRSPAHSGSLSNLLVGMKSLPYFCRGEVNRGFGRGSKELGIPTANFPDCVVEQLPADISTGIYYGWACVGNGDVHKMVMSIGWNPYYKNTKKSMETHVIHKFKEDFYGDTLSVVMVGYIRPERSYESLEALIAAINGDIAEAKVQLERPEHIKLRDDNFFTSHSSSSSSSSSGASSSSSQTIINGH